MPGSKGIPKRVSPPKLSKHGRKGIKRTCFRSSDCPRSIGGLSGMCHGGFCSCHSWYTLTANGCVEKDGFSCTFNSDCTRPLDPLYSPNVECFNRRCRCKIGYRMTQFGCETFSSVDTGVVSSVDQPIGSNSFLDRNSQHETRSRRPVVHPTIPALGKPCVGFLDCPTSEGYDGTCSGGMCMCKPFYHISNQRCVKDSNASSVLTGSFAFAIITTLVAYMIKL
ncbi:hypothetical protein ElyMa_004857900 [Elysia marginata]|uniref:EB domain-containing protein n=1 Tax=Elysia marginata TaxID=1093978 RepID=A0AAV4IR05_9GAST|nr:hypothetical protein ElyMa_004857900 [Elysia marginata]